MKYRSEIDGLRAVAVIPVIFFHAGISVFSGGFVGVDVFFVISGYLITTIILSEMEKGQFSIINFYERRARRILPALFLVMLVSLPFAWMLLLPGEMIKFSESLIAVSSFLSNVYFRYDSGYWATANELKPMLHTWSLAVEEQYYVLFPLFLMLMWRYRRRWILASFILIVGVSLGVAQWGAYNKPTPTFFLLPTRVWELGIGTLIAFYFLYGKREAVHNKLTEEILSFIGLLMIIYAVFNFDETTPFPSFYALIPTLGAGLIILFATGNNLVGRLLGNKLVVAIGLISYSAYLWHQPLLAFSRNTSLTDPIALTVIAALSLPLAYLSWKYVEKPFRTKNVMSRKTIFYFSAIGLLVFISFGLLGKMTGGLPSRYDDNPVLKFVTYDYRDTYREGRCFLNSVDDYTAFKDECFSKSKGENSIILWGDSHIAALYYGLDLRFDNLTQLTSASCPPLLDFKSTKNPPCFDNNNYILSKTKDLKPRVLILHANWSSYKVELDLEAFLSKTITSVKSVSPKTKIVIIGGVPQWKPSLPKVLLMHKHRLNEMNYVYSSSYKTIQNTDQILEEVANENQITFISLLNLFCKENKCLTSVKQGEKYEPFVWDYGHLTEFGSSLVSERIVPIILQEK